MKNLQKALAEIIANLEIEFKEFQWTITMQAADKRPVFRTLGVPEAGYLLKRVVSLGNGEFARCFGSYRTETAYQFGKNDLLITPAFGPRVRFARFLRVCPC